MTVLCVVCEGNDETPRFRLKGQGLFLPDKGALHGRGDHPGDHVTGARRGKHRRTSLSPKGEGEPRGEGPASLSGLRQGAPQDEDQVLSDLSGTDAKVDEEGNESEKCLRGVGTPCDRELPGRNPGHARNASEAGGAGEAQEGPDCVWRRRRSRSKRPHGG